MNKKKYPQKLRKKIALMRLLDHYKYRFIAEINGVSIGTVQNCEKQYKAAHPIWLKVRTAVHKLVNYT